jgi:hypothetical protein
VKSPQILRGIYWYKPTGVNLEIVGNRFRYNSDSSPEPSSWVSISKLHSGLNINIFLTLALDSNVTRGSYHELMHLNSLNAR